MSADAPKLILDLQFFCNTFYKVLHKIDEKLGFIFIYYSGSILDYKVMTQQFKDSFIFF